MTIDLLALATVAVSLFVPASTRVALLAIALRNTKPHQRAEIIRALGTLFRRTPRPPP